MCLGVFFTGGSLNPARSFGPCVATRTFPSHHYIYWLGPLMGTLLAFGMYKIVKSVEYQTVNPGQDFDDHEVRHHYPSSPSRPRPSLSDLTSHTSLSRLCNVRNMLIIA